MTEVTFQTLQKKLQLGQREFHRVSDGIANMAVDGSSLGTPVNLWNGTGASDTGSDWTTNGIGSETTASKYSGTNGWDTGVSTSLSDTTRFTNPSGDSDINGTYEELSFWMQPKAFPSGAVIRARWQNNSNTVIGNQVNIANYVTNMDLDVWQRVSIPIEDFSLDANVSKLQLRYRVATGQQFWFDDFELYPPGSGGPFKYRVRPETTEQWHLSMMVLVISAPSSGWNPTAFADITGGLEKGLIVRQYRMSTSEVLWGLNSKDNVDLFGRFHPQDDVTFPNGDLLIGFMIKPGKASVIVTNDEVLEFFVRDDLSSLTSCRAFAHFGVEELS